MLLFLCLLYIYLEIMNCSFLWRMADKTSLLEKHNSMDTKKPKIIIELTRMTNIIKAKIGGIPYTAYGAQIPSPPLFLIFVYFLFLCLF